MGKTFSIYRYRKAAQKMGQDPVSPAWAPFTPTQSMPAKAASSGEKGVLLKGPICSHWSSWSRFGISQSRSWGPISLAYSNKMESPVYSGFARKLLSIHYFWESGNRSQMHWTQTHLREIDLKNCPSPMTSKISFVLCERRGSLSCSSCAFFFFCELIWKESSHLVLMIELLNTQKHWPNLAPISEHFTVQFRAKERAAVFPGKGHRGKR